MTVRDWTKLITIIGVLLAVSILGYTGKLEGQAVAGIIAACLGYVFGNAHGLIEEKKISMKEQEK